METRKLQRVGGGTYTVSIPKQWAVSRELEAGATVSLHTHRDGSIVIRNRAEEEDAFAEIRVSIGDDAAEARRTIRAAQAVGFERLILTVEKPFTDEMCREVRSLVREIVGTELVEENERELVVRNLLGPADSSVDQSVGQLRYVALSVSRQAVDSIADGTAQTDHLEEREIEVKRLSEMVVRHFNRALVSLGEVDHLGTSRPELFVASETARQLRGVTEAAVDIARAAGQRSDDLSTAVETELTAVAADAQQAVEEAASATFDGRGIDAIHRVHDEIDAVQTDVAALETAVVERLSGATVADVVAVVTMLEALSRTLQHGQAMADVALQAALRAEGGRETASP